MQIEERVPLAPRTSFGIGGLARFFVSVSTVKELRQVLELTETKKLPHLFLGGGSNVLFSDKGYPGVVVVPRFLGIERQVTQTGEVWLVGAGEVWDELVARTVDAGLWGMENLSGIPGSVGASPIQNIGAYGVEIANILEQVDVFDTQTKRLLRMARDECRFGYRTSIFKQEPGRYCVTRVGFSLSYTPNPLLGYRDLAALFSPDSPPTLTAVRDTVLAIRQQKFPDLAREGTAGSFFLNPIITRDEAKRLQLLYPELPQYDTQGGVKISLAWLLDHVLHAKGYRIGGARLFELQPLVIVADRNTSSEDVRALMREVIEKVFSITGVRIQTEVQLL